MTTKTPDNFVDIEEFDESTNILLYGDSGVGKTVWLRDCDLIIATEPKTISAKRFGSKAKVAKCYDWPTLIESLNWVDQNPGLYPIIGVDSLTRMHRIAFKWKMAEVHRANPAKRDIDLPDRPEHLWVQNTLKRYVEMILEFPSDVVFTAGVMATENLEGDQRLIPAVHGQQGDLSRQICHMMSCVGYMEVKDLKVRGSDATRKVRRIHWQPYQDGTYFGNDLYNVLGEHTDDKSLVDVLSMINSSGEQPRANGRRAATKPAARRARTTTRRRAS